MTEVPIEYWGLFIGKEILTPNGVETLIAPEFPLWLNTDRGQHKFKYCKPIMRRKDKMTVIELKEFNEKYITDVRICEREENYTGVCGQCYAVKDEKKCGSLVEKDTFEKKLWRLVRGIDEFGWIDNNLAVERK